jgi:hypothetical protein
MGNPLLPGQLSAGNIDLRHRPSVPNPEGGYSTVFSESGSRTPGGSEILYPRVVNGQILSSDDAWRHALSSGENLGTFGTIEAADQMGQMVHRQQEQQPLIDMLLRSFKF